MRPNQEGRLGATGGCPPNFMCGGRPRAPGGPPGGVPPILNAGDTPVAPGGPPGGVPPILNAGDTPVPGPPGGHAPRF